MMTREELMALSKPQLLAAIDATKRWPKSGKLAYIVRNEDLVNFLLKCQDDGIELVRGKGGKIDVRQQAESEPNSVVEEAPVQQSVRAPRAPKTPSAKEEAHVVDLSGIEAKLGTLEESFADLEKRLALIQEGVNRLINIGLHLYAIQLEPKPRSFFETPFESLAGLDEAPVEPELSASDDEKQFPFDESGLSEVEEEEEEEDPPTSTRRQKPKVPSKLSS